MRLKPLTTHAMPCTLRHQEVAVIRPGARDRPEPGKGLLLEASVRLRSHPIQASEHLWVASLRRRRQETQCRAVILVIETDEDLKSMFGIFADRHRFHFETVHHAFQLGGVKKANDGDTPVLANYSNTIDRACEWAVVRLRQPRRFGIKGGNDIDLAGAVHIHSDERSVECGRIGIRKAY